MRPGPENITQRPHFQRTLEGHHRPRFIRYVNRCKIMPPYCRRGPMRMLPGVHTRVRVRIYAPRSIQRESASRHERRRPDGRVKTHLSLGRRHRLFRGRAAERGGKKADLIRHQRRLHSANIFRELDRLRTRAPNTRACVCSKGNIPRFSSALCVW